MAKLRYKHESKLLKTARIIKNIIFAVILVVLVGVITITMITRISGKTPSFAGYTVFRVSSGSMVPTFQVGDIILSKSCDPMTLKNGDIVTYNGTIGEFAGKSVTHRVIKEPYEENGEYYLVTKGDDNPVEDTPISVSQVTGLYVHKIELLKWVYDFFITPWGLLSLVFLIILAFFNEIVIFVKALLGIGFPEQKPQSVDEIIAKYEKEKTDLLDESEHKDTIEEVTLRDEIDALADEEGIREDSSDSDDDNPEADNSGDEELEGNNNDKIAGS